MMMMPPPLVVVVVVYCLLQLQLVTVSAGGSSSNNSGNDGHCSYDYNINCSGGHPYMATTAVTLSSGNGIGGGGGGGGGGGQAYVTFHWGNDDADSNVGTVVQQPYFHSPQTLTESHTYYSPGEYYAGVSIVYDGACDGVELRGYKLLKFSELDCEVIDLENMDDDDDVALMSTSSTMAMVSNLVYTIYLVP
jgi:hypothetical protein